MENGFFELMYGFLELELKINKMVKYLGEKILNIEETEYKNYTKNDWIILFLEKYGTIEGIHHKNWLIDTIAQIAKGTEIVIKLAKWDNDCEEYRFFLDKPSKEYIDWVETFNEEEEGWIYNRWKNLLD
jgi:hypothetical protein